MTPINGIRASNQDTENQEEISNDKIMDALDMGRGLLADCSVRAETLEDNPNIRFEWTHGSVAPNVYANATSGTAEERAVQLWRFLSE